MVILANTAMAPDRKALIIFSDNCSEQLVLDSRMRRFLYSTHGGGWRPSEIISLFAPTSEQLTKLLKVNIADFSMVFYFGTSFVDHQKNRFLLLNGNDFIQCNELEVLSNKQLIFILPAHDIHELPQLSIGTTYERIVARSLYDKWIMKAQPGKVSCVFTEYSQETFTQMLLEAVTPQKFSKTVEYKTFLNISLSTASKFHSRFTEKPFQIVVNGSPGLPFSMTIPANSTKNLSFINPNSFFKKFTSFFNTNVNTTS